MPVLRDFRPSKTIVLPTMPDSKVEIYDSLLVGELSQFDPSNKSLLAVTIDALPKFIKSWNFTDEQNKPLEINRDNINFLKEEDARYLIEQIVAFNAESKKKIKSSPQ